MPSLDSPREFTISFSRLMRVLMTPLFAGPGHCRITIWPDRLRVSMGARGWAFAASISRSAILEATPASGRVWSWGAHGWRGRWLVNGSSRGPVRLTLQPPERGRCLGFPINVRELTLSLDDPDGFIEVLHDRRDGDVRFSLGNPS